MMSGPPREPAMFVQDWQVRFVQIRTLLAGASRSAFLLEQESGQPLFSTNVNLKSKAAAAATPKNIIWNLTAI
jgi:hypothetical protein